MTEQSPRGTPTDRRQPTEGTRRVERIVPSWFDAVIPHPGSRLLSRQWLGVFVWFAGLAAFVVNAATMPSLYRGFVPLTLVASLLHAVSLPVALNRPRAAVLLSTISLGGTVFLTSGREAFPWPIPVVSLIIVALLCAILALREPWPHAVLTGVLAVVIPGICALVLSLAQAGWRPIMPNLLTAASVLALVTTFGVLIRSWLTSRAELLEQQELTVAEQERRHLVEERTRIARELHDVVAHSLSIISIQASTVRYRFDDVGEEVIAELDEITDSARTALVEMRGLLAVLRQEDGEQALAPQPTLSRIPSLIESARRGSSVVNMQVHGELDDTIASETTSISAYRIVQEALSNAIRHEPGGTIDVQIGVGESALIIDVQNASSAEADTATAHFGGESEAHDTSARRPVVPIEKASGQTGGFGLLGMRERATFAGGSLHAGPLASGGFLVHAELPLRTSGTSTDSSGGQPTESVPE